MATPALLTRGAVPSVLSIPYAPQFAGVDASFLPQYDAANVRFYEGPAQTFPRDPLVMFASRGINVLRLRVWNNPINGWCSPTRTLAMAARAKALGMDILVDFHYSDSWADPGQQTTPAAWQGQSVAALAASVYEFTRDLLLAMKAQGTPAKFVQVGNEVTDGVLWPVGRISTSGFGNCASG